MLKDQKIPEVQAFCSSGSREYLGRILQRDPGVLRDQVPSCSSLKTHAGSELWLQQSLRSVRW